MALTKAIHGKRKPMKINTASFKVEQKQQIKQALIDFINQPDDKTIKPCPTCPPKAGTAINDCKNCSPNCHYVQTQMSSAPEKYPIEAAIQPLVYAFYTLRLTMPCWSCEGHTNHQGEIFKTPKLWFYSAHEFYPKLVAQYISALKSEHKLDNHWSVRVLPFSQSLFTTTYSLEPLDINAEQTNLLSLQQDIKIIAQDLREGLFKLAKNYIEQANNSPIQ